MPLAQLLRSYLWHCRIQLAYPGAALDRRTAWTCDNLHALAIGDNVSIGPFGDIVVLSRTKCSAIFGRLSIGARTAIGSFANIRAAGGAIIIGSDCLIGQNVSLIAANHQIEPGKVYWTLPWDQTVTGITIGRNCWIGAGATILPGCTIGDNSIIGAGAVVTKNVPANEIWANIPARRIGLVSKY